MRAEVVDSTGRRRPSDAGLRGAGCNKDLAGSADEPIGVSTIHSAKGLEFPRVVLCGLGGGDYSPERLVADRKTLYVGFTRAVDDLAVVTTADNVFAKDFEVD